jgi:yjeF C-terminal region, hydroxyethylthiazole kinase-related/yjeF N-terminal region
MRAARAEELRKIDRACVEELGIPMMVLMENAVLKLFKHAINLNGDCCTVVCGTGNNGGDALGLARHLKAAGKMVFVFILGNIEKGSEAFLTNYKILCNMGLKIKKINDEQDIVMLIKAIQESGYVVDGIFGTGLNRSVEGIYNRVIDTINTYSAYTLCIDIPSGMHCDTGEVLGNCVRGSLTVSFELTKLGFFSYGSRELTGDVIVESIGIPKSIINKCCDKIFVTDSLYIKEAIRKRDLYSHKGDFGRVIIIGGSKGFYGAPVIAAEAAMSCGSGLVTAAASEDVLQVLKYRLKEAMTVEVGNDRFKETLKRSDCAAIGPGLGTDETSISILREVIDRTSSYPLVLDADALNILAKHSNMMRKLEEKAKEGKSAVITPHPGEMSRLTGETIEVINSYRVEIAREYAREKGIIVLLKGYNTVITDGEQVYINPTGNSAMASGGMGDCLTGIIASLIGQGLEPLKAAVCGAYIHGYSGDKLSESMHSVTATDINKFLPFALKEMLYH